MKSTTTSPNLLKSPAAWIGLVALLALAGIAVLATRGGNVAQPAGVVKVVAAENFWGDIASQIGGRHVKVTSIITDPTADPHLYESNARNAAAVASADIVITNGLGYDDFMDKLLGASGSSHRTVLSAQQIMGITDEGANPHLWYDTPKVAQVAAGIEAALAAKDPADKAEFEHNLAAFDDSLKPITDAIAQIKSKYPGAPVAYTEPVPGYLLAAAGLAVKTPEGFAKSIEEGDDPSPADAAAMDNLMTSRAIKVLLYNSQATSPVTQHARDLATAADIPVIGVTETLPQAYKHYQDWQLAQVNALLKALAQ
jgi:zinc/manganese transport system substrate-binding protein